jgi:predicted  nucleic acid-binding Zn-ribbon protein
MITREQVRLWWYRLVAKDLLLAWEARTRDLKAQTLRLERELSSLKNKNRSLEVELSHTKEHPFGPTLESARFHGARVRIRELEEELAKYEKN